MSRKKNAKGKSIYERWVGDFETSVYEGQTRTDVWSSALVPILPRELTEDDVIVHGNIDDTFKYLVDRKKNIAVYYHNLKFDGEFWLSYLLRRKDYKDVTECCPMIRDMPFNSFMYIISSLGQWYEIAIKTKDGFIILLMDSLKLLPFSVRKLGKDFQTKHQKLEMEYEGIRLPNCKISGDEMQYIKNDVLVVAEALQIMFRDGHNQLTIGSCCMHEYKKTIDWGSYFPQLEKVETPEYTESKNVDEYIRRSYRGGWCYVRKDKAGKIFHNGCVADVNSLYPSVMSSASGSRYPIGNATFWKGDFPKEALKDDHYYFVRIKCQFKIKEGYLPFIQIKGNLMYKGNEMLETSDVWFRGKYYDKYVDIDGTTKKAAVILTLTKTDYELFHKHYNVYNEEILDGCWFYTMTGLFDTYINHYAEIKMHSVGAQRQEAKLFLNNLYGKMATSTDSSYKIAYLGDKGEVRYKGVEEHNKKAGYIAIGSAITSYARAFTITAAQKNYNHFIYADTDSIHCDCKPLDLIGVPLDEVKFCHWKIENKWDTATFVRQKTYLECDGDNYILKCAGMPQEAKKEVIEKIKTGELSLNDFKPGLEAEGKLMPMHIKGGIVLVPVTFKIKEEHRKNPRIKVEKKGNA